MAIDYVFNPELLRTLRPAPHDAVWRYTDVPKFASLLARRALYFARLDRLDDPFEGSLPRALALARDERTRHAGMATLYDQTPLVQTWRRNTIVSCWHVQEFESAAMWGLYARNGEGLAIRSTFERLIEAVPAYAGTQEQQLDYSITPRCLHVVAGLVDYIDFADERIALDIGQLPYLKRRSFEHERELRLVCRANPYMGDPTEETCFPGGGDYVPVDLGRLVDAIFVAPQAPAWFADVVRSLVKQFGLSFEVRQSSLAQDPVF
jgi:hypothetical protein